LVIEIELESSVAVAVRGLERVLLVVLVVCVAADDVVILSISIGGGGECLHNIGCA
jgi:hypothetical protein